MVICAVCNRNLRSITHTHLKTHGINSVKEYKERFPEADIVSQETRSLLSTNREEYWITKHGEKEGKKKYQEYKKMLSDKNTFEYKQEKFGWTREDFDEYNKSRAVTKENLIGRHGEDEGIRIWDEYRERQSFAGCKIGYFIEKYGEERGVEIYESINERKKHTLETFVKKYGNEGEKRYYQYVSSKVKGFNLSKGHKEFIELLLMNLEREFDISSWKIHEGLNGKEFVVWDKKNNRSWMYDLVITSPFQICIEYDGDYWHCNPAIFNESDVRFDDVRASEVWKSDKDKQKAIEERGFQVYRFWDSEFRNNQDMIIERVINWIRQHQK